MTQRLFLGGPLAGWREVPDDAHVWRYPIIRPVRFFEADPYPISEEMTDIGTYTRRRFRSPGWCIDLIIFTCNEAGPWDPIPAGTVLPGLVQGMQIYASRLRYWRYSERLDGWHLVDVHGNELSHHGPYGGAIISEFIAYAAIDVDALALREFGVPLHVRYREPDERPRLEMPRRTPQEVIDLLDGREP